MTRLTRHLLAFALAALALCVSLPADAAQIIMCRGTAAGTSTGPARWVAPGSGTAYSVDVNGCINAALADVTDAQAGGFAQQAALRAIVFNIGVATGTTDFVVGTLPASTYIHQIVVANSVAAAVTGGIAFGTTANGTDIVTALTCGSTCLTFVADSALSKRVFSLTAPTPIHAAAVTAWNSTNVTVTILYSYF